MFVLAFLFACLSCSFPLLFFMSSLLDHILTPLSDERDQRCLVISYFAKVISNIYSFLFWNCLLKRLSTKYLFGQPFCHGFLRNLQPQNIHIVQIIQRKIVVDIINTAAEQ